MERTEMTNILQRLHFQLFEETVDFSFVDFDMHIDTVKEMINEMPFYCSLSSKYTVADVSLNEKMLYKYLCIYVYFEYLYDKLRNDANMKNKLYDNVNKLGNDNNFFGKLKLYTVYYGTKITKYFENPYILKFLSCNFLMLNIFEAVITDLIHLRFDNSVVGMMLYLSVPFKVNNFKKDEQENILCNIDKDWINLYTSWNSLFTYSDSPGKDYFPRTSVCLLNSYKHSEEWLNNRAYTLFASHVLKTFEWFNFEFGLADNVNENVVKDWNYVNKTMINDY